MVLRGFSELYGLWKMYWMACRVCARPVSRVARERLALEVDVADDLVRVQAGDAARQRGLAGPGLADQREAVALGHARGDVVQRLLVLVERGHVPHADDQLVVRGALDRRALAHQSLEHRPLRADLLLAPAAHLVAGTDHLDGREPLAALVDRPVAARRERAARGPLARARRPTGDAAQGALAGDVGDGGEQLARVRVVALAKSSSRVPISTIRPAYMTAMRSARLETTARSWVT